jgi:1-acyl-sn-glycerol-3-phosphate acyltransferase
VTSTDSRRGVAREDADELPGVAAGGTTWVAPLLWRVLLVAARVFVPLFCRLRVTGDVPAGLRRGPLLLAGNHTGMFDPFALVAACRIRRLAPRIMATGGVFRIPVAGPVMRRCGHIRVERWNGTGGVALARAVAAIRAGSVVAGYPEGRITLDPAMWPERGRTGLARVALATGATVIPVAQWGAHEVLAWDRIGAMAATGLSALWRRPVVRVHFGPPVDLSGLRAGVPGHAQRATDRITEATIAALRPLRADEPGLPRHIDHTRPVSTARAYRERNRTYSTTA